MTRWTAFRYWLIRLLGGHPSPVERKIHVQYEKVIYNGLGRPFDDMDWDKLAIMNSTCEPFFRFLALQIEQLDAEERAIPYSPEHDRARLALAIRRACYQDLRKLPDTAAGKVVEFLNKEKALNAPREKGFSNHGK